MDAGAPGADAGTDRVHFPLDTVDGHLGAGAHRAAWGIGFPGHGHDAHRAFLDFRYLIFKQVDHQAGVGPAHKELGTAAGDFAHFLQEHLEGGVRPVVVVGELVAAGKLCFHLRPAQARTHCHDHGLALKANHPGCQDGIFQVRKFLLDHAALLVAQLLGQHLLGGGGGHATEVIFLWGDIEHHRVADLGVFGHLLHFSQSDLVVFAFDFFNDDF